MTAPYRICVLIIVPIFGYSASSFFASEISLSLRVRIEIINGVIFKMPMTVESVAAISSNGSNLADTGELFQLLVARGFYSLGKAKEKLPPHPPKKFLKLAKK